jgi:hypothetical protein
MHVKRNLQVNEECVHSKFYFEHWKTAFEKHEMLNTVSAIMPCAEQRLLSSFLNSNMGQLGEEYKQ